MTYLILIRHAEVKLDPAKPASEWRLSSNGRHACTTLAQQLAPYQPQQIVSSVEPKASMTGQLIATELGIPCQTANGLQEHDRQGVPFFTSKEDFETAVATFFHHPDKLVFGNETANQTRQRFTNAIQAQLANIPQGTIAITSHGTAITLFVCHHNPALKPSEFWRHLTMPCALILARLTMKIETILHTS